MQNNMTCNNELFQQTLNPQQYCTLSIILCEVIHVSISFLVYASIFFIPENSCFFLGFSLVEIWKLHQKREALQNSQELKLERMSVQKSLAKYRMSQEGKGLRRGSACAQCS